MNQTLHKYWIIMIWYQEESQSRTWEWARCESARNPDPRVWGHNSSRISDIIVKSFSNVVCLQRTEEMKMFYWAVFFLTFRVTLLYGSSQLPLPYGDTSNVVVLSLEQIIYWHGGYSTGNSTAHYSELLGELVAFFSLKCPSDEDKESSRLTGVSLQKIEETGNNF